MYAAVENGLVTLRVARDGALAKIGAHRHSLLCIVHCSQSTATDKANALEMKIDELIQLDEQARTGSREQRIEALGVLIERLKPPLYHYLSASRGLGAYLADLSILEQDRGKLVALPT